MIVYLKTLGEIEVLDAANNIVQNTLTLLETHISEGISTLELNDIAEKFICNNEATPSFKGYGGFPAASCISINEEIVHGVPSNRILKYGDIVSIDIGVKLYGFHGDGAKTFVVGDTSDVNKKLIQDTRLAVFKAVDVIKDGNSLYDINRAIEAVAKLHGYGNIRDMSGHGIGKALHEEPSVYNYVNKSVKDIRLQDGIVLALEPMFCLGSPDITIKEDKWTVATKDRSISAHWEVSVAMVGGKCKILGV